MGWESFGTGWVSFIMEWESFSVGWARLCQHLLAPTVLLFLESSLEGTASQRKDLTRSFGALCIFFIRRLPLRATYPKLFLIRIR